MKNSQKIKAILISLQSFQKIPADMNDLDTTPFEVFDNHEEPKVGGFKKLDISSLAEAKETPLTDDQVEVVFFNLGRDFDASLGIDWTMIEDAIAYVLNKTN